MTDQFNSQSGSNSFGSHVVCESRAEKSKYSKNQTPVYKAEGTHSPVAQLVERQAVNLDVVGSRPAGGAFRAPKK